MHVQGEKIVLTLVETRSFMFRDQINLVQLAIPLLFVFGKIFWDIQLMAIHTINGNTYILYTDYTRVEPIVLKVLMIMLCCTVQEMCQLCSWNCQIMLKNMFNWHWADFYSARKRSIRLDRLMAVMNWLYWISHYIRLFTVAGLTDWNMTITAC